MSRLRAEQTACPASLSPLSQQGPGTLTWLPAPAMESMPSCVRGATSVGCACRVQGRRNQSMQKGGGSCCIPASFWPLSCP